jgi:dimethylhistidine N-methyltransferase
MVAAGYNTLASRTQLRWGDDIAYQRALIAGLSAAPKYIPCKFFYDETGARLFEQISQLPEYYPTRVEYGILRRHAAEMAARMPPRPVIVELGSGEGRKVAILLQAINGAAAYVPVDIDDTGLERVRRRLSSLYPDLPVLPVHADFSESFELPASVPEEGRVGFFPGSTIGNFDPEDAAALLERFVAALGRPCTILLGYDLRKDVRLLHAAYNDSRGMTAAFNLNLLVRANRTLGANFVLSQFVHRAFYQRALGRIEMHLISACRQRVSVAGHAIAFEEGESIHTENSYKYDPAAIAALAARAGLTTLGTWTDARRLFAVALLGPARPVR